jgi:hypothetical protein
MKYRVDPASRRPRFVTVSDGGRSATVMIGPLRGPEHLALIHQHGYYHVPVSAVAASRSDVAFVAFYQPAARFGTQAGVVREYARVVRVSRVRRRDLPGLTWSGRGTADTLYYRFDLGPLLALPAPITNPERWRVAFRFPDLARFLSAETIRELGREAPDAPLRRGVVRKTEPGAFRNGKEEETE